MDDFRRTFFNTLIVILQIAIIGRALISWFPLAPTHPLVKMLNDVTEPVLSPLRRVMPKFGMLDLTPMIAIILLSVIQQVLLSA